ESGYQLLCMRCDSIPLSDKELEGLIEAYKHNKLVMKKARGSIEEKTGSIFGGKHSEEKVQNPINTQKSINHDLRKPIGFIGGGVCLILFVIFWIYISSDE
ncbi:MAG: hypothetical protein IJH94_07565, partial [Clostridia bacterium]|nr:hypothetical protein [Clostridia bacterium]